jgi:phage terminase Nu1 subunit (DNA packaging protein)
VTLVTVEQLASEFGRTARHVQLLVKAGMPRAAHGQYDLELCKTWYIGHLHERLAHRQGEIDGGRTDDYNVDRERARLTKAQADQAELELAKMRGTLVPIAEYKRRMSRFVTQARQQLLQLPGRAAPQLEGDPRAVIKSKLYTLTCAALAALSAGEVLEDESDAD